jgi:hypothetical protein
MPAQPRTLQSFEQSGLAVAMLEVGNKDIAATIYGHGNSLIVTVS